MNFLLCKRTASAVLFFLHAKHASWKPARKTRGAPSHEVRFWQIVLQKSGICREVSRPNGRPPRSLVASVPARPMPPSIDQRKWREDALSEAPQVLGDGCKHELVLHPAWTA